MTIIIQIARHEKMHCTGSITGAPCGIGLARAFAPMLAVHSAGVLQ